MLRKVRVLLPMSSDANWATNKKILSDLKSRHGSRGVIFFAIGQIYFGIFQTLSEMIALFIDGQYSLVS